MADPTLAWLQRYDWPGDIRELQHAIAPTVILAECDELPRRNAVAAMPVSVMATTGGETSASVERKHIRRVL